MFPTHITFEPNVLNGCHKMIFTTAKIKKRTKSPFNTFFQAPRLSIKKNNLFNKTYCAMANRLKYCTFILSTSLTKKFNL